MSGHPIGRGGTNPAFTCPAGAGSAAFLIGWSKGPVRLRGYPKMVYLYDMVRDNDRGTVVT
jgi:hypothetical protein